MVPPLRKATWQQSNRGRQRSGPILNRPTHHFDFYIYLNILQMRIYFVFILVNVQLLSTHVTLDSCFFSMFTNSKFLFIECRELLALDDLDIQRGRLCPDPITVVQMLIAIEKDYEVLRVDLFKKSVLPLVNFGICVFVKHRISLHMVFLIWYTMNIQRLEEGRNAQRPKRSLPDNQNVYFCQIHQWSNHVGQWSPLKTKQNKINIIFWHLTITRFVCFFYDDVWI